MNSGQGQRDLGSTTSAAFRGTLTNASLASMELKAFEPRKSPKYACVIFEKVMPEATAHVTYSVVLASDGVDDGRVFDVVFDAPAVTG